jgi:hypothetical protein
MASANGHVRDLGRSRTSVRTSESQAPVKHHPVGIDARRGHASPPRSTAPSLDALRITIRVHVVPGDVHEQRGAPMRGFTRCVGPITFRGPLATPRPKAIGPNSLTPHVNRRFRGNLPSLASVLPLPKRDDQGRRSPNHPNRTADVWPLRSVRGVASRSHRRGNRGCHGTRVWTARGRAVDLRLQRRRDQ